MKFVCWNLKDKKFFILKRRGIWTWKRITSNLRKAAKHISLRDPLFTTLASSIRNYSQTHSGHISKEKKGMRHIQSRRDKSNYYDHPLKRRGVTTAKRARAKRINVKDTLFVLSQMWNIHNQKKMWHSFPPRTAPSCHSHHEFQRLKITLYILNH